MRRKAVLLLTLIVAAASVIAACGIIGGGDGAKSGQSQNSEPFDLKLRHIQLGDANKNRLARLEAVLKKTQEQHPGLTIRLDGVDSEVNRKDKLRSEMAAGNPPDIFDTFGSPDVGLYAKEGLVLDIAPILQELGLRDKFLNLEPWTHDGKIYGLPNGGSIEGYFYNKQYFAEKGLELPKTLADLEAIADKIKADGKIPFARASKDAWVPLMTINNLWSYYTGPHFTAGFKTGESKWTDPRMVEAISKHQEWVSKGYFKRGELGLEYADQRTQLLTGEAIMMFDGTWGSSGLTEEKTADGKSKFGFFLMPPLKEGDGISAMVDTNNGYAFSAKVAEDPRKLEAVKSFILNFYNEEIQLRGLMEDGVLPSLKMEQSKMEQVVDSGLILEIIKRTNEVRYRWPAFDALIQAEVDAELRIGIQRVMEGDVEPAAMLADVQKMQDEANMTVR
ncbi:extracellular solute-binding protein [Paenibacillus thiaminolyticus]|uniref:Extracellular solute-binding protein n=1 Tax=Paenibacillus thiaminolyticus TaxID=49283 RepID=A0AAP9DS90_PANTH|nr:extracellular solute-binding protein [Paenibacillus thiaminolyticus]MCY9536403.1 extracellular solute-binding protein [Paenibacillus thiaminolyticus]MCY9601415.1 extracellular solute-binding protein [Paenibacillus thiaminolyticus]MCY9609263.1 extracellular solute-binding protein [Paenibacillus thiaminolyticus]MCY9613070.1 extracellular solute-binding protein [Paenibacillus thiaminolyticus]MCY9616946.1 extracellular solute-binding protein [Paenibacillus thiaminolyticus]